MVLCIVGERLGRFYVESNRRPVYSIDSIVRRDAKISTLERDEGMPVLTEPNR